MKSLGLSPSFWLRSLSSDIDSGASIYLITPYLIPLLSKIPTELRLLPHLGL
mgnify:CR=1 FL=1